MGSKKAAFYSLPEVWDFCLEKIYNKEKYAQGLIDVMKSLGVTKKSKILDAGCGSGFPALDLIADGYTVTATDKSSEMVRQIGLNGKRRGLTVEAYHVMWAELSRFLRNESFDFIYCGGNSLVYAASWEQNWIVPARSREEIQVAIKNFYEVLSPGGHLYVDLTQKNEKPHEVDLGLMQTSQGPVRLTWRIEHNLVHKIRTWTMRLVFDETGAEKSYPSFSYLLSGDELVEFLTAAGFSKVRTGVRVVGEKNYDVFIARK